MKILMTGFDPFGSEKINPAYEAVKKMQNEIKECVILKEMLPTVFNDSLKILEQTIEREKPDVVICVGQAGGRNKICLERIGINLDEAPLPDNKGQQPVGRSIKTDGENAYFSTLPNKVIVKTLVEAGIPAAVSYSAGTYVCNHVLYGLLHMIKEKYPKIRGGFVHVPFLPEQALKYREAPHMSLEMITEALDLVAKTVIENDEDIEYLVGETM